MDIFNRDLNDEQAVCKMGPKNADFRVQAGKGRHFQERLTSGLVWFNLITYLQLYVI